MPVSTIHSVKLPRWKCHKEVDADKIVNIRTSVNGQAEWVLACGEIIPSDIVGVLIQRSAPRIGDFYVVYEDGYQSWSPAKAFEDGYTRL